MENLPKNWGDLKLNEVVSYKKGKKPKVLEEAVFDGAVPYLDIKAFEKNEIRRYADKESSNLIEKSDIGIVWDGARSGWVSKGKKGAVGSTIAILKPIKIESDFLFRFLQSKFNFLNTNTRGTGIPHVDPKILWNIDFPLPPLAEQQRIVAKLDGLFGHLDSLKQRLEHIPTLLKQFRQSVLTQAVTGKLTEEWREGKELEDADKWRKAIINERSKLNLPKRTPGLVYKKVDGSAEIPDNWTYGYLQNFGEFTRGKSKHRPRNDVKLFGGDYPFIQTGEVARSNGLITEYKNTYSEFGLSQSRLFPKGTLCITIAANIAETGILDFDACFPDSVVGYLPYKDYYTTEFAMYCLNVMQKDLEHYAPATAQKNINLGILFEVPFPIPSKEEQTEIILRVKALFAKADRIEAAYQNLKQQIDSLPEAILAKAFKGELVEQLPTDGDAKELLKEITALRAFLEKEKKSKKKKKQNN